MLLQIHNSKVKSNLSDLDLIINPLNGDWYFITGQECVYSYYMDNKNNVGSWTEDKDLIVHEKASVLGIGYTDVTSYYPNELELSVDTLETIQSTISNNILTNNKHCDVIFITSGNKLFGLDLPYNTKITLHNDTSNNIKIIKNSNKASINQRLDIGTNKTLPPKESISFFRASLNDKWRIIS